MKREEEEEEKERERGKQNKKKNEKKVLAAVGFEPTPPKRLVP